MGTQMLGSHTEMQATLASKDSYARKHAATRLRRHPSNTRFG